jgi:hypothetical protein
MKLHSDILTKEDIYEAAKIASVTVWDVREFKARVRKTGWEIFLSGSSSHRSQATQQPAATWDEHGLFMADLYKRDPELRIAFYKSLDHFLDFTRQAVESEYNRRQPMSKKVTAPWLEDSELLRLT